MTLRLTVDHAAWSDHIADVARQHPWLVPVVKGNGYGFGRGVLHQRAAALGDYVCVGTVFELDDIAEGQRPVVLTPADRRPDALPGTVLTVGDRRDLDVLDGWHGEVLIKLQSSMLRFGVPAAGFADLLRAAHDDGHRVLGVALHLPLRASDETRVAEVEAWLEVVPGGLEVWLSHLTAASMERLTAVHPDRTFRLRVGSALWHGDKRFMHLTADVVTTNRVRAGNLAGYHQVPIDTDGTLVVIGAGSSHGIARLDGGASPFHFRQRRLALLENPHMHASLCVVPVGHPTPEVGDAIDVQRPLINVFPDETIYR